MKIEKIIHSSYLGVESVEEGKDVSVKLNRTTMKKVREVETFSMNLGETIRSNAPKELREHISVYIGKSVRKKGASWMAVKTILSVDNESYKGIETEFCSYIDTYEERQIAAAEAISQAVKMGNGNPDAVRIACGEEKDSEDGVIFIRDEAVARMVRNFIKNRKSTPESHIVTLPSGEKCELNLPGKSKPSVEKIERIVEAKIEAVSSRSVFHIIVGGKKYEMSMMNINRNNEFDFEGGRKRLIIAYLLDIMVGLKVFENLIFSNGVQKVHSFVFVDFVDPFDKEGALMEIQEAMSGM